MLPTLIERCKLDSECPYFVSVRPGISLNPRPNLALESGNVTFPTCYVTGHPAPMVT